MPIKLKNQPTYYTVGPIPVLTKQVDSLISTGGGTPDNITIPLPAKTLGITGNSLDIEILLKTTTADVKSANLIIGGSASLLASTVLTTADNNYMLKVKLIRKSSTSAILRSENWRALSMVAVSQGLRTDINWDIANNLVFSITSVTGGTIELNYLAISANG